MNFSKKDEAIIRDKPIEGQIRIDDELLLPKTSASPSESEQLCKPKCSEYAFSEDEDEKSADTRAKEIFVSQEYGTFEDEDSEKAFEEFDLDEYEFTPWENLEICCNCTECENFNLCHRGRKHR